MQTSPQETSQLGEGWIKSTCTETTANSSRKSRRREAPEHYIAERRPNRGAREYDEGLHQAQEMHDGVNSTDSY